MKKFEFVSFTPTPFDDKCLGIAEVKMYFMQEHPQDPPTFGIQRFKVLKNEGGGVFIASPSVKVADNKIKGDYEPSFYLDSRFLNEQLHRLIKESINESAQIHSKSVFGNRNERLPTHMSYPSTKTQQSSSNEFLDSDAPF